MAGKYKVRKGRVAAAATVLVILLAGIIFLVIKLSNNKSNDAGQSISTVNPADIVKAGEYVDITLNDCNMYVGSTYKLTCVSNPESYASMVQYTSNNPDVVDVDGDGTIYVLSVGTAAITATYDVYSDAVVINAVEEGSYDEIDSDMPVYEIVDGEPVAVVVIDQTDESDDADAGSDTTETTAETETSAENNTQDSGNATETTTSSDDEEDDEKALYKGSVIDTIVSLGFDKYLDDTYILEEDGNYLGEVIVGDEFVQIYVMTRTTSLDQAVKSIEQIMLPTSYESVFGWFVSATENTTLVADGHKVRIVAPANGSHTEMIIYY